MRFKPNPARLLLLVLLLSLLPLYPGPARAQTTGPLINEIRIDQPSTDNDEYFELTGPAGASLDGLTYLVIGDGTGGSGVIEAVVDLNGQILPAGGLFVAAESTFSLGSADLVTNLNFENSDNVTHLLVRDFGGANGDDLDTDDDGTLDLTPWSEVLDLIALIEEPNPPSGTEYHYGPPTVGPDGSFVPAHVLRCPEGWQIGPFDPDGGVDTPGAENQCGPPPPPPFTPATIMEIQGDGQFSPFEGQFVETAGVVTLFTANGSHFWLQDPGGDGDPATSDGIFVSGGAFPTVGSTPAVGDRVRVIAEVQEQQFFPGLPLTRLTDVHTVEILSGGNPLPEAVLLTDLPNVSITDGIDFWEPLEGMRVAVHDATVVAATSRFGEFALVTLRDALSRSGYFPATGHLLIRSLGDNAVDYNPERILVDDSSLDEPIVARPHDYVQALTGVVDYTFGNYKLQPESYQLQTRDLPDLPASRRVGPAGNLVVTTFNLENLFDLEDETGVVSDAFGQVGFDPGSQWGSGDTSTRDNTLRRKPDVCQGDTDGSDPFDPALEWEGFAQDTFDGLGTHSAACPPGGEIFISEYVEGSSFNKAIEIYNGTGSEVDLGAAGYAVQIYFNGSNAPGQTIHLSGILPAGDVFVLANSSAGAEVLSQADQTSGGVAFNGDDAILLNQGDKDDVGTGGAANEEELDTQLTKLALAIQVELATPEIIVVQEVENQAILQVLGDRVNAAVGTDYTATSFESSDGRGIEVGFLWDAQRVDLLDAFQLSDEIVPGVSDAFGFSSPSPGREPLVGVFDVGGAQITIVGNHFKSKGGDDPLFGVHRPPIRVTEEQRKAQARVVRDYVDLLFDADPWTHVMVTGDLNDFQFGEPGEGSDHPIAILEGGPSQIPLVNLIDFERRAERFTFVFDGNSQVLDHMLVSPALLLRFRAVDVLHFNAGYPAELDGDATTTLRASDHDPVEGRFRFWGAP